MDKRVLTEEELQLIEELEMNEEAYIELTDGKGEIPEGVDDDD